MLKERRTGGQRAASASLHQHDVGTILHPFQHHFAAVAGQIEFPNVEIRGQPGELTPCAGFKIDRPKILVFDPSLKQDQRAPARRKRNVAACTGVTPDSTEVLFLASNASNQAGNPAIAFFFTGVGVFPPQGLTDAGGSIDISGSGATAGIVNEANCSNASCTAPSNPSRSSVSGTVTGSAVPEPATWLLLTAGFALMASFRLRSAATRRAG